MGDQSVPAMLSGEAGLVTGAGRGLGAEIAIAAAAAGASVLVNDIDRDGADATVATIRADGGTAEAFEGDIARETDVVEMVAACQRAFGQITFACNSAIPTVQMQEVADLDLDYARRMVDVALLGTTQCLKHELRAMKTGGRGAIVNITSTAGARGQVDTGIYSACKAGIEALTRIAANECGPHGVRVNALQAGAMMTPALRSVLEADPSIVDRVAGGIPLRRIADPSEVARSVVALLSSQMSYVTGAILTTDGGGMLHVSSIKRQSD